MASNRLTPFSYAVLALVGRGGASAHDIVQMMRRGRAYWAAAESHWYAEPKRLAALGHLSAEPAPGKTRDRTVYRLTERGREALGEWLTRPTGFPRIQSEAVVRLLAADLGDSSQVAASIASMRAELDGIDAHLDEAEQIAARLPHRERSLRLIHALGRELVRVHRDWVDRVERELR